jgi:predicted ferric reductase
LKGLLAQKVKLSVPRRQSTYTTEERQLMNWGMLIAVAMLVVWAIGTVLEWSGWIHGLLTVGVFLLIRALVRTPARNT